MCSTTTGFQPPGGWPWSEDRPSETPSSDVKDGANNHKSDGKTDLPGDEPGPYPQRTKHWRPRTCRICLETVLPTFQPVPEFLPGVFQSEPTVTYESEGGRLIQPCKCKGSSRYVHASCLQEWRHADSGYSARNYWQCPTCHFRYRLERMRWGRWISSQATQVSLTFIIFFVAVFVLGFVADFIINIYLDPYNMMASIPSALPEDLREMHLLDHSIDDSGWTEHFVKGFASLGLIGLIQGAFIGSFRVLPFRMGLAHTGNRAGTTARDRIDGWTWIVIVAGVCAVLYTIWKRVRAWSRRTLEKASEHVMDVQGGDDDEEEEKEKEEGESSRSDK